MNFTYFRHLLAQTIPSGMSWHSPVPSSRGLEHPVPLSTAVPLKFVPLEPTNDSKFAIRALGGSIAAQSEVGRSAEFEKPDKGESEPSK